MEFQTTGNNFKIENLIALTPNERLETFYKFFEMFPIYNEGQYGYGLALIQFLQWEISSGRITHELKGGSPWFRAVNGFMVFDLQKTLNLSNSNFELSDSNNAFEEDKSALDQPPFLIWQAYTRSDLNSGQQMLWKAHQASIHFALKRCNPLIQKETKPEQEFINTVVELLEINTRAKTPTYSNLLGTQVKKYYPINYPISIKELNNLMQLKEKLDLKFNQLN